MATTYTTLAASDPVEIRANMIDNLTEYYPVESKNTSFYFLLSAYADIVTDVDYERVETILDVGIDEARNPALYPNFGYFYSLPNRGDLGWDWYDYRFMLKVLAEAWTLYGSTAWGFRKVGQVATGISPVVLEHYRYAGWILEEHILGATAIVQTGDYIWNTVSSALLAPTTLLDAWPQQQTRIWLCGAVGGAGGVWFSSYAGEGTSSMAPPAALSYEAIHGVGPYETWACGTTAGGGIVSHWHHIHGWDNVAFAGVPLRGIWMWRHNDGWVVGDAGNTYHWDGTQWTLVVPPGAPSNLFSVHGTASNAVYATGANTRIIRWDGAVWNDVTPAAVTDWRGVYVLDGATAWVCGLNGYIMSTANSGATWGGPGLVDANVDFHDIWVSSDGQTIRAVGEHQVSGDGILYYSTDGGTVWGTETTQGQGQGFRGIYMRPNETMGFICGEAGTFLRRNGQSPGYTLVGGTYFANGELIYGSILESRHGRRNSVDVIVWNVRDYNLLWRFLNEMKPAHVKLFLIYEVPFASGYYSYDYYGSHSLGQYEFDGAAIDQGIVINGRDYGDSMSRVVVGESELHIPQLS